MPEFGEAMNDKTELQNVQVAIKNETAGMTHRERQQYMLTQCDAAILAIMTGAQSYSIAGQSLTRASLKDLMMWRNWLIAVLAGGRRMTPVNFSPSNKW